ncbi:hypothetical protein EIN_022690 [Entamoeba invadens IP1]|uniref:hypothetical protein n=1 Tax=Entamoeba invadens IP1 TaxID=370355 RepID=UPI0002C3E1F7|nr:hypothetical protein EIN_022690 [Entamoeba invadens IP1]ELP90640.1 hypothetical protein EIN_022690 [Entamoeba invadens IP1]|eukprot:XP_004257411.1 hypothetical protein EIN_022690 [Entamoeba invadens IP1]
MNKLILTEEECKQLEEWTDLRVGNCVFDSLIDNWDQSNATFRNAVLGKNNLVFIVKTDKNLVFGGFVSATIESVNTWNQDMNAFVFTMNNLNTLPSKMMFKINNCDIQNAFLCEQESSGTLFRFGNGDIMVYNRNIKASNYCVPSSYSYGAYSNALLGSNTSSFKVDSIAVFEMV